MLGGLLVQDADLTDLDPARSRSCPDAPPTDAELRALRFAWRVAKHAKSNAIVLTTAEQVVGVGAGPDEPRGLRAHRGDARARSSGSRREGTVCASDAFFPFRDGLDVVAEAGATAVIHPGRLAPRRGGDRRRRRARHGHGHLRYPPLQALTCRGPAGAHLQPAGADPAPAAHAEARSRSSGGSACCATRPGGYRFRELVAARVAAALLERGRDRAPGARGARRRAAARARRGDAAGRAAAGRRGRAASSSSRTGCASIRAPARRCSTFGAGSSSARAGSPLLAGLRAAARPARGRRRDVVRAGDRVGRRPGALGGRGRRLRARASPSIPTTPRRGTTSGCSSTAWATTSARGECYGRRSAPTTSCCQAAFNLGSLHEDLGDFHAAITWYRRALEMHAGLRRRALQPRRRARQARAAPRPRRVHWRRYLELDLGSPWAQIARVAPRGVRRGRRAGHGADE